MSSLFSLLQKKANSQLGNEDAEEEDDKLFEMQLIQSTFDCIVDVSKAMGPHMEPFFSALFPLLVKYMVNFE